MQSKLPPTSSLARHVSRFCQKLRQLGFLIGPEQTIDSLRAIEIIGVANVAGVKEVLRLVLCSSPDEQKLFDELFERHFRSNHWSPHEPINIEPSSEDNLLAMGRKQKPGDSASPAEKRKSPTVNSPFSQELYGIDTGIPRETNLLEEKDAGSSFLTSILHRDAATHARIPVDDLVMAMEAAKLLLNRAKRETSRRLGMGMRGRQLDFRRTLRINRQGGSEIFKLAWKCPKPKPIRFVLFCDGSRSMSGFAERFLQFAYALTCCSSSVDVFLFSTHVRRVTAKLYRTKRHELQALSVQGAEWGGGTRIGESLATFIQLEGRRMLGKNTVVMIGSDGLETGSVEVLQQSMKIIHSRSASVIWLNPLLAMPGYEPTARGMQAALPYIDTFSHADDARAYKKMAAAFRCRR
ncbi:vWA domain-containing protein [Brevibacillus sp. SIMBA_040]|uniref:vWA domain-containing protein n=1 Tax=unclassified Brevibacillus TaxID=2684853 RepID=UPI00397E6CBA